MSPAVEQKKNCNELKTLLLTGSILKGEVPGNVMRRISGAFVHLVVTDASSGPTGAVRQLTGSVDYLVVRVDCVFVVDQQNILWAARHNSNAV